MPPARDVASGALSGSESSITVGGVGRREITPDLARWTFDVTASGEDEAGALSACIERTGAVLVALREAFGDDVSVTTGPTTLHESYNDDPEFEEPPTARASVTASLPAELAGRAAPIAVRAGAKGAHGPHWELAAAEAVRDDLLVEAFAGARRKAQRLADAAGRSLGEATEIREGSDGYDDGYAMAVSASIEEVPVSSPTPALTAVVTVTFALV